MIAVDEDALECDFLEVYGILDYRALPPDRAALYACGLGLSSRISQALAGNAAPLDILLRASALDALNLLVWQNTKNGHEGKDQPASLVDALTKEPEQGLTVDEFRAWLKATET